MAKFKNEKMNEVPKKKGDSNRTMMVISPLISVVLFIIDLYMMMNRPGNYAVLLIVTLLLLAEVYFFISSIFAAGR